MATRLQIEKNDDGDERLEGGRNVVHRWTITVDPADLVKLSNGEPVKLSVALPNLTVKHLFVSLAQG